MRGGDDILHSSDDRTQADGKWNCVDGRGFSRGLAHEGPHTTVSKHVCCPEMVGQSVCDLFSMPDSFGENVLENTLV
jgi:hypothetical protein